MAHQFDAFQGNGAFQVTGHGSASNKTISSTDNIRCVTSLDIDNTISSSDTTQSVEKLDEDKDISSGDTSKSINRSE